MGDSKELEMHTTHTEAYLSPYGRFCSLLLTARLGLKYIVNMGGNRIAEPPPAGFDLMNPCCHPARHHGLSVQRVAHRTPDTTAPILSECGGSAPSCAVAFRLVEPETSNREAHRLRLRRPINRAASRAKRPHWERGGGFVASANSRTPSYNVS